MTGETFGFLLQVLRCGLIAAATTATGLLLLSFSLLLFLLALGEFLQFAEGLIDFLRVLLLFALLDGFVLVLALIQFQFEQVGNVLRTLRTTAASATALTNLDFGKQRFGTHQILQCLLFKRLRSICFFCLELIRRRRHLVDGGFQIVCHLFDHLVLLGQAAAAHALEQGVGHFRVLGLICGNGMDVVDPFFVFIFVLVVDQLVRRSNDVPLPLRQRPEHHHRRLRHLRRLRPAVPACTRDRRAGRR